MAGWAKKKADEAPAVSAPVGEDTKHWVLKETDPVISNQGVTEPTDVDYDVTRSVENIPRDVKRIGSEYYEAFSHPIETATNLSKLLGGVIQKATLPPEGSGFKSSISPEQDYRPLADAVGEDFKKAYGTGDRIKRTLMEEPLRPLEDVSMLLSGGATAVPKMAGKTGKIVDAIGKTGAALDPFNMAYNLTKGLASVPMKYWSPVQNLPQSLYSSALKLDPTTPTQDAARKVQTGLEEDISISKKGVAKLQQGIAELEAEVQSVLSAADASGSTTDFIDVLKRIEEVKNKFARGAKAEGIRDEGKIDAVVDNLVDQFAKENMAHLKPSDLNDLKKSMWEEIYGDKTRNESFAATDSTRKAIGDEARTILGEKYPEINAPMSKQSDYLNLMEQMPRKAQIADSRNIFSLSTPGTTLLGGMVGDAVGAPGLGLALGGIGAITDLPRVKGKLARELYKLQQMTPKSLLTDNNVTRAAIRQGLLESGQYTEEDLEWAKRELPFANGLLD